jgi:hypothetical protein
MPIAFTAQARENGLAFSRPQLQEVAYPSPRSAPLFPVAPPDTATQPPVELGYRAVVFRDAKVVHPASEVPVELVIAMFHRHPPASARPTADLVPEVGEGSLRPTYLGSAKRKAEERAIGSVLNLDIIYLSRR